MDAEGPPMPVEVTATLSHQFAHVSDVLPVLGNLPGILQILCDLFAPAGVSRQNGIAPYLPLGQIDVELLPLGIYQRHMTCSSPVFCC